MSGATPQESGISLPGNRRVPDHAIRERATTSGGPGGQHANRSATCIELSVLVHALPLSEQEHARLTARLANRISVDGWISVRVSSERSQLRNRSEARDRMEQLLRTGLQQRRRRIATKTPRSAVEGRLEAKRRTSALKRLRGWRGNASDDG